MAGQASPCRPVLGMMALVLGSALVSAGASSNLSAGGGKKTVVAGLVITGALFELNAGRRFNILQKILARLGAPTECGSPSILPSLSTRPGRRRGARARGGWGSDRTGRRRREGEGPERPSPGRARCLAGGRRVARVSRTARPAPHPCGVLDVVPGPGPSVLRPPAETPAFRMACATMYIMRQSKMREFNGLEVWFTTEGANKLDSCAWGKFSALSGGPSTACATLRLAAKDERRDRR